MPEVCRINTLDNKLSIDCGTDVLGLQLNNVRGNYSFVNEDDDVRRAQRAADGGTRCGGHGRGSRKPLETPEVGFCENPDRLQFFALRAYRSSPETAGLG